MASSGFSRAFALVARILALGALAIYQASVDPIVTPLRVLWRVFVRRNPHPWDRQSLVVRFVTLARDTARRAFHLRATQHRAFNDGRFLHIAHRRKLVS